LNEVRRCADRVVVLRDGRVVGKLERGEIAHDRHDPPDDRTRPQGALPAAGDAPAASALEIIGLRTAPIPAGDRPRRQERRDPRARRLVGSGRSELARAIFGIDRLLGGRFASMASRLSLPRRATPSPAASTWCPEDRKRVGLLLDLSVAGNISLPDLLSHSAAGSVMTASEAATRSARKRGSTFARRQFRRLWHAVRRQSAEGCARQVAGDATAGPHLRRADTRHRCRRQERDL
jgi:ribose transport system ATP-binding protein